MYTETHTTSLSYSACKIAHQAELLNILNQDCKKLNFTIVSNEGKECEFFFTAESNMHLYYDAFCVQLLPCPAGFVLLRGVCEFDPLLSKSDLYKKPAILNRQL